MSMSRQRPVKSLYECVNPEYLDAWGGCPTVKEAIDYSIDQIARTAYRRRNTGYEVYVLFPDYKGKRAIVEHIFAKMSGELRGSDVRLHISDDKFGPKDVIVSFVPFTAERSKNSIPVCWSDDFADFTWSDVIANGQLYASSSKDVWPPNEYQMRAQRERMQRRYASNPFA